MSEILRCAPWDYPVDHELWAPRLSRIDNDPDDPDYPDIKVVGYIRYDDHDPKKAAIVYYDKSYRDMLMKNAQECGCTQINEIWYYE